MIRFHQVEVSWIVSDEHLYFNWAWFFILGFLETYSQPTMLAKFLNPSNQLIICMNINLLHLDILGLKPIKETQVIYVAWCGWSIQFQSYFSSMTNNQYISSSAFFILSGYIRHRGVRFENNLHSRFSCYHPFWI
jgi:hypothetical protein